MITLTSLLLGNKVVAALVAIIVVILAYVNREKIKAWLPNASEKAGETVEKAQARLEALRARAATGDEASQMLVKAFLDLGELLEKLGFPEEVGKLDELSKSVIKAYRKGRAAAANAAAGAAATVATQEIKS